MNISMLTQFGKCYITQITFSGRNANDCSLSIYIVKSHKQTPKIVSDYKITENFQYLIHRYYNNIFKF